MNIYDVIIIGSGPGGYVAAIRAAQLGAKVAVIEKEQLGGTCLNRGCIPTKALISCVNLCEKMKKADGFGISTGDISIDLRKIVERKDGIVKKLTKGVQFLLEKNGVEIITGEAQVLAPGKVAVGGRVIECGKIILATGSSPAELPACPIDGIKYLTSDHLLEYHDLPAKLDIIGGGVIGIHFARIYSALGAEVTIYEALPEILPGVDEEVVLTIKRILKRKKINVVTNVSFEPAMSCGCTLVSIGRTPNVKGLEALGLKTEGRRIWVNEKMETGVPGVYAIGDLVSKKMLAHVASEQGVIAAENAMGGSKTFTYDFVPFGIYTDPEIGCVGLTEKAAREKHQNIKVGKFPFAALGIAQAMGEIEGFVKVIADPEEKVLGMHIIGPEATSLIGLGTLAMKNGIKVSQLAETFQAHPTYPEGVQEAALAALGISVHSLN